MGTCSLPSCAGIQCWALSPPGGLMSTNLARLVEPFVTSVVLGKDVVPRSSVANLGRLIDQMVQSPFSIALSLVFPYQIAPVHASVVYDPVPEVHVPSVSHDHDRAHVNTKDVRA